MNNIDVVKVLECIEGKIYRLLTEKFYNNDKEITEEEYYTLMSQPNTIKTRTVKEVITYR